MKKPLLDQTGASKVKITAIILIALILVGGALSVVNSITDQSTGFSDEEMEKATVLAQEELNQAFAAAEDYSFYERALAIKSIGYGEPDMDETSTLTFEKHNEDDVYILLKLQPHETYGNLSRVIVQIFDKEKGLMITELNNVVSWKEK